MNNWERLQVGVLVLFVAFTASVLPSRAVAQGRLADYERMESLSQRTRGKVYRTQIETHWLPNGEHLWYRVQTGASQFEFVFVNLMTGTKQLAFDHRAVAEQLHELSGREVASEDLPFRKITFDDGLANIQFRFAGKTWQVPLGGKQLEEVETKQVTVPQMRELRPSVDKGGEMELTFANQSTETLQTVWIDRSGRRVNYQSIRPGKRIRQHTFEGHVWLVLNESDQAVALFEANGSDPLIAIDGKEILEMSDPQENRRQRDRRGSARSPSGRFVAFVRDHHLFVRNLSVKIKAKKSSCL